MSKSSLKITILLPFGMSKDSLYLQALEVFQQRIGHYVFIDFLFAPRKIKGELAEAEFLRRTLSNFVGPGCFFIFLDENGKSFSSLGFSRKLKEVETLGSNHLVFVLGGAYGLPANLLSHSQPGLALSLSSMTFPHEMALILLLEQIYRGILIQKNHPYHHEGASDFIREKIKY